MQMQMQMRVPADHPCLSGHFPGQPIVPGVVILDEVIAAIADQLGAAPAALQLIQIKFLRSLRPEQTATLSLLGDAPTWTFAVHHGEALLANGRVRLLAPL